MTLYNRATRFGPCAPQILDPGLNRPPRRTVAELRHDRGVIPSARIALRLLADLADLAGLVVPSATPLTRRRIGEPLAVRAGSAPGGSHHEHLPAFASA